MVKPPTGGLLCINPEDGKIDGDFCVAATASVNAAVPCERIAFSDRRLRPWQLSCFNMVQISRIKDTVDIQSWMSVQTPIYHDGNRLRVRQERRIDARLRCRDRASPLERGVLSNYDSLAGPRHRSVSGMRTLSTWTAVLCLSRDGALNHGMDLSSAGFELKHLSRASFCTEDMGTPRDQQQRTLHQSERGRLTSK